MFLVKKSILLTSRGSTSNLCLYSTPLSFLLHASYWSCCLWRSSMAGATWKSQPRRIEHTHVLPWVYKFGNVRSDCGITALPACHVHFLCPSLYQFSSCSFICSVFQEQHCFLCSFLLSIQLRQLFCHIFWFLASQFFFSNTQESCILFHYRTIEEEKRAHKR